MLPAAWPSLCAASFYRRHDSPQYLILLVHLLSQFRNLRNQLRLIRPCSAIARDPAGARELFLGMLPQTGRRCEVPDRARAAKHGRGEGIIYNLLSDIFCVVGLLRQWNGSEGLRDQSERNVPGSLP